MNIEKWFAPSNQMCTIGKHTWSIPRLFQLAKDLPVMEVPLDHLNIDLSYSNLKLRGMVMHMKAVLEADLSYPIILDEDGGLMDGRHRIMRALLEGKDTIKAVRFDENPRPCQIHD